MNTSLNFRSAEPKTDMPENVLWSERELAAYIKSKRTTFFAQSEVLSFVSRLNKNALEAMRERTWIAEPVR